MCLHSSKLNLRTKIIRHPNLYGTQATWRDNKTWLFRNDNNTLWSDLLSSNARQCSEVARCIWKGAVAGRGSSGMKVSYWLRRNFGAKRTTIWIHFVTIFRAEVRSSMWGVGEEKAPYDIRGGPSQVSFVLLLNHEATPRLHAFWLLHCFFLSIISFHSWSEVLHALHRRFHMYSNLPSG